MRARPAHPPPIQFSTHNPHNLIVVERCGDTVLVRAAHDNFSERRRAFLIRQLAAEGYIPDPFEQFTEEAPIAGLTWIVDRSLMVVGSEATDRTRRFMHRLITAGCLLWLFEVALAFLAGR
jgi:hypothetical protein